jgi:predicted esterase
MEPTFEEIKATIQRFYQQGNYGAALELATQNAVRFPEKAPLFNYWMICMTAGLDRREEALRLLDELLNSGFWFVETLLRKSPALRSLQGDPRFEAYVELNLRNQTMDQASLYPLLTIRPEGQCRKDDTPCPFLIALHSNGSDAPTALGFWKTVPNEGWLLALPQSTQPLWKDAYVWDDLEVTSEEVRKHYRSLIQRYAVDQRRMVLAGHDMGAEVAIWIALSGLLPSLGFIGLAPHGPFMTDIVKWRPYIESAQSRLKRQDTPFRGTILLGEDDKIASVEGIRALVDMLNTAGIPCALVTIPEAGHELSPEFEAQISKTLENNLYF